MSGYLPPDIDQRTDHLHDQGCNYDDANEPRHMKPVHDVDTEEVADDRDDIGHYAALLSPEIDGFPPLVLPVEMDEEGREKDGQQIDKQDDGQFVREGQQTHITEQKQNDESQQRQVKRGEDHTHHPGCLDNLPIFQYICIYSIFR
jgi:hypothetical protein